MSSSESSAATKVDEMRITYGFGVVLAGFALVAIVFVAAVSKFQTVSDVTSAVGLVTSVVGTLAGAFFGVHVGSTGKEKADAARKDAESKATVYARFLTKQDFEKANRMLA